MVKLQFKEVDEYAMLQNDFILYMYEKRYYLGIVLNAEIVDQIEIDKNSYMCIKRREGLTCQTLVTR